MSDLFIYWAPAVRPQWLTLSGVVPHVVQGTGVAAMCVASGANPSASITWYNGTDIIPTEDEDVVKEEVSAVSLSLSVQLYKCCIDLRCRLQNRNIYLLTIIEIASSINVLSSEMSTVTRTQPIFH